METKTLKDKIEKGDIQLIADKSGLDRQIVYRVLRNAPVKQKNRDVIEKTIIEIFRERETIGKGIEQLLK